MPPSFADNHILDFTDEHERPPPTQTEEEASPWPPRAGKKNKKKKRNKNVSDSPPEVEESEAVVPELNFLPNPPSPAPPPPTEPSPPLPPAPAFPADTNLDFGPELNDPDLEIFTPSLRRWQGTAAPAEQSILDIDEPEPEPEPEPAPMVEPTQESRSTRAAPETLRQPSSPTTAYAAARSPRLAQARPVPQSTLHNQYVTQQSPPQHYAGLSSQRAMYSQNRRKSSFNTHPTSPAHPFSDPPPPHLPQPHFFGLPDFLDMSGKKAPREGKLAGSDGYCCNFDSLSDSGDAVSARKAKDVLLVGSEGGVDVYRILPNKLEVVGHLEGLRGGVIDAKILPHTELMDGMQADRPLIAVIVHGPAAAPTDGDRSRRPSGVHGESDAEDEDILGHYQTTVEVYSLRTQSHIATLYKSARVAVKNPSIGHLTSLPAPIGDLSVAAKGKFVTVASGKSGEVFVFSAATNALHGEPWFRCIGKYWTSLQMPTDSLRPTNSRDGSQQATDVTARPTAPLLSLSQRWLALVPPTASQNNSILGSPLLSEQSPSPVGLASHIAPSPPPITCDVAGVDEEGTWGRLTRQAAQGIVRYSQKGIEMGWQGWKELTNPTPQSGQGQQHARSSSKEHEQFPPTKALPEDASRRTAHDPAVVSIIDLEKLVEAEELKAKHPPLPLATVALTEGCNYLSLSSNGLRLVTVSRSGEVSTTWDLTQSCHGIARYGDANVDSLGPCVKQILRIPRSSQAVVVDAAWSRDDDYLALLTTHGTVHLHEIPSRAASKKRRRRRSTITTGAAATGKTSAAVDEQLSPSPPAATTTNTSIFGTLKSGWQQVSTGVNTIRTTNPVSNLGIPTSFAGFKEATTTAGHVGGRLVTSTLRQGYAAAKGGASDYWHSDDNKIRHRPLTERTREGSMRWIHRQGGTLFAVVCGGSAHLYSVVRVTRRKGDELVSGLKHERGSKVFPLQPIRTREEAWEKRADDCSDQGPHGFWTLRSLGADDGGERSGDVQGGRRGGTNTAASGAGTKQQQQMQLPPPTSTSHNDVETNPPYCPFHVDPRVNIFAFDPNSSSNLALHGHGYTHRDTSNTTRRHNRNQRNNNKSDPASTSSDEDASEPWVFGAPLPPSMKMNSHDASAELPTGGGAMLGDSSDEGLAAQVESRLTVVTSTTGGGSGGSDGDGGDSRVLGVGGVADSGGAGGAGVEEEIRVHTRPAVVDMAGLEDEFDEGYDEM